MKAVGVVVEVPRSDRAVAVLFKRDANARLGFGTLVKLVDDVGNKNFLAMVIDVQEKSVAFSLREDALEKLSVLAERMLERAEEVPREEVLMRVLTGAMGAIRTEVTAVVELKVLGELKASLVSASGPVHAGSLVLPLSSEELQRLFTAGHDPHSMIKVGKLFYDEQVDVFLNPHKLTTHLAVLGQTGSGKTETVKRIVYEIVKKKLAESVIVFDVAGEYVGYPYRVPEALPLLDAVVDLNNVTVLVPYRASAVGFGKKEMRYLRRVCRAVEVLKNYGIELSGYVIGRQKVYDCEGNEIGDFSKVLSAERRLLVAFPLPDVLSWSEVEEFFADATESVVDSLAKLLADFGVVDGERVYAVKGASELLLLADYALSKWKVKASPEKVPRALENFVKEAVPAALEGNLSKVINAAQSEIGVKFFDAYAFKNFVLACSSLAVAGELSEAGVKEVFERRREAEEVVINTVERVFGEFSRLQEQTKRAITRRLRTLRDEISAKLDYLTYSRILKRMGRGTTFVLLTEPARGPLDIFVGKLINDVFEFTVEEFVAKGEVETMPKPKVIVLEEAHNWASKESPKACLRPIVKVAREGRKWGLSLVLVSQRPGFIDSKVLSQAATLVALRITNPDDLSNIRRSVESVSQDLVERLPDLGPGEALLSGLALPVRQMPVLVKVERLAREA